MARKKGFDPYGFKKNLRAFEKAIQGRIKAAVDASSNVLADEMRVLVPVDTGITRESIEVKPVRGGRRRIRQRVDVTGGDHDRGEVASVEYGNFHQVARPFVRPAISRTLARRKALIARAARKRKLKSCR